MPPVDIPAAVLRRITDRSATVGVIGLGYVGLPLAAGFARAGFKVIGVDLDEDVCAALNTGHSHIPDVTSTDLGALVASGRFRATASPAELSGVDAISIAVPTPLGKTGDPDMSHVHSAAEMVADVVHPGLLVVLESTTYPGTTREVILPLLVSKGYTAGKDVFVAFSPQRIDPGNPLYNTKNTPKVLGALSRQGAELAAALYSTFIDTVVTVSSTEVAELVKLLENTFRSVNVAMANEMAIICDKLGVDVWEVIDAAATKPFGFMKFTPGPGIGGTYEHREPHYLAWKMRSLNYKTRFIDLASEVNSSMPAYVVEKIAYALNTVRKPMNGANVLIVGVAYKGEVEDVRESPALDIVRLIEARGGIVSYHDPYVPTLQDDTSSLMESSHSGGGRVRQSRELTIDTLTAADVVVIVTDHERVDTQCIIDHCTLLVDTRNATAGLKPGRARIFPLSASA